MKFDDLDAKMRQYEKMLDQRFPRYGFMVARLDGRNFTKLTKEDWPGLEAPFDRRFNDAMVSTVKHLMRCGFEVIYGFTESDEISLIFKYGTSTFERKVRKFNSVLAGEASAHFTAETGHKGVFDCRIICLPDLDTVEDYFRWRQEDAHRNALNSHLYWMYRKQGLSATEADRKLLGISVEHKRIMLQEGGIDFDAQPHWQLWGVGVYPVRVERRGLNPKTGKEEIGWRNELRADYNIPIGDPYGKMVRSIAEPSYHREGLREEMSRMDDNDEVEKDSFNQTLDDLERQCKWLSEPILNRMGWRIIRKIGKQMANNDIDQDMAGLGLSFFDQMSIYYQSRTYEEFMFGFDDYLDETIQAEIDNLTAEERMILVHRNLDRLSRGEMENKIFVDVKNAVSSIIDQHYYTAKIQRFVDRYDLHG